MNFFERKKSETLSVWIQIRANILSVLTKERVKWNLLVTDDQTASFNSKTCLKQPFSKRTKIGFQDQLSLNASQKYWKMLQGE